MNPRISKRDHRTHRRYNARSISNQSTNLFNRRGIIDNLKDICKKHPNPLCLLLPPSKPPNPPRTTGTQRNPPATSTKAPTPAPTPAPAPAPTPKPSQAPSAVNPPAASSNANPSPNTTMRDTSQGAPTLSSSGTSGPLPTNSDPADTLTTDRGGGPSNQSTANPQGSVPFGIDPSSTVGVGNNDNPLPGNTGIANSSASAAGANAGPIIGGILGAVFLVLIILAALVWFRQKRNSATRVAPSSEFMGGNRQYPFAGGIQGQQARLSNPETRSMGNSASAQNTYDIRRGV